MQHNLNADVESADLHSVVSMARLTAWVIRNANGRLASAIPPLGADEHIALVNTITFHGKWKDQFKRANTHTGEFYLEDGTTKMLPMMSRSGAVQIAGGEVESPDQARWQYTVACLRYGDGSMSMLVVLPRFNHRAHLSELLPLVSAAQVDQWISHLEWSDRGLTMPRFQVNCRPELDSALKAIGLSRAYDSSHADFTAMGKGRDGRPIYLSHTIQNAYLEVDEEGTRAGAMTMHRLGLAGEHASIMVDRPFICLIRDNRTGMIVFAGAIYDPQAL
jgi:serpin B